MNEETRKEKARNKIVIRDIAKEDFDFVLELNRVNVEVLSPMDSNKLLRFVEDGELVKIVEVEDEQGSRTPAAFIIVLREGLAWYDSENYRWFSANYPKFLYIDRIVIDEPFRNMGIGRKIYEYVFAHAEETSVHAVTAEIDIIPYNEPSLIFHQRMGFREVGTQVIRGGAIKVSLQVKE